MSEHYDHVVIGGGVMGLAAAWQLAARGRSVVLLERFAPGHTRGASHGATRNMNNAYDDALYLDLYDEALGLWNELAETSGERLLTLCGLVTHGDQAVVTAAHDALAARGAATELIDAEAAAARWPGMRFSGRVLVNRDAGRIHSATALEVFAAEARRLGADLRFEHRVTAIAAAADGVVVTGVAADGEPFRIEAGGAVVAAGAWSRELLRDLVALPALRVTEEHPAHFTPQPSLREPGAEAWWPSFNHVRTAPSAGPSVGAVYGMLTPGEGVKVGFHAVGDEVDPDARRFRAPDLARAALREYVAEWFPGLDPDTAAEISCTYTSTESGRFVLDRVGPITVAAGFSGHGFKFAPAIGRVLADAALGVAFPPEPFRLAAH
ncbi:FAD-dependent oxidoreductase [Leucobacter luti]|uniref:Sarcosine oxidase n=1 Tax=Leucobacter luti TaxID=340320 RepID=A0A4Q7TPL0_9MICO|nr:FAD-dependent oxidoreductase [Leucobacter luti]MBL3699958.1 FAD-dependent oxidoreductase [Leucobacter luti]RZT62726.1 sarcosine oxidase [Leucobacter luti]